MTESLLFGLLGGIIIGLAASLMLVLNGRVTGVSGIYNGILQFYKGDVAWRIYFVLGLLMGGFLLSQQAPELEEAIVPFRPLAVVAIGGILVGFGTVMGTGCTSGHGICGLARFSRRSLAAVVCFMITGMITATAYRLLMPIGGQ